VLSEVKAMNTTLSDFLPSKLLKKEAAQKPEVQKARDQQLVRRPSSKEFIPEKWVFEQMKRKTWRCLNCGNIALKFSARCFYCRHDEFEEVPR